MATPEIYEQAGLSEPENEVLSEHIDPIELATDALAKLKRAGHSGVLYDSDFSNTVYVNETEATDIKDLRKEPQRAIGVQAFEITNGQVIEFAKSRAEIYRRDYQDVVAARQNPKKFDELLAKHEDLLSYIASTYFLKAGGDTDDLIQEANIGFIKAVRDFDGSQTFKNFLRIVATRQVITAVKTSTRGKHSILNDALSFEEAPNNNFSEEMTIGEAIPSPAPPVEKIVEDKEGLAVLVKVLKESLSALESGTLRMFLEGSSYGEMAKEFGVNEKTIDNALQRIKRKIQTHIDVKTGDIIKPQYRKTKALISATE